MNERKRLLAAVAAAGRKRLCRERRRKAGRLTVGNVFFSLGNVYEELGDGEKAASCFSAGVFLLGTFSAGVSAAGVRAWGPVR